MQQPEDELYSVMLIPHQTLLPARDTKISHQDGQIRAGR
jgi:hypothetical protein